MKSEYSVDDDRGLPDRPFQRRLHEFPHGLRAFGHDRRHGHLAGANHMEMREAPPNGVHILQIHGTADSVIIYGGGDIQDVPLPRRAWHRAAVGQPTMAARWKAPGRELRDLDASLPGHESGTYLFEAGCRPGGSAELWTIPGRRPFAGPVRHLRRTGNRMACWRTRKPEAKAGRASGKHTGMDAWGAQAKSARGIEMKKYFAVILADYVPPICFAQDEAAVQEELRLAFEAGSGFAKRCERTSRSMRG